MVAKVGSLLGVRVCVIGLLLVQFLCQINAAILALRSHRSVASTSKIQSCLAPSAAKVVFPGSSIYETSRGKVFNHRNLYKPAAIVFPTSIAQVQNAVTCAVQLGIGISPRSGGHSYEDYSLGGRDGVLVVDLGGLTEFSYDSYAQTATVGPGFRLGPLKLALWNAGKVTIPSGTCPSVGVAGHALGGGWGLISRKFGMMADSMLEAKVVINNGSVVTTNANENSDLFRALKGAGANSFGIVVQFKFKVYDVSQPMTYFQYGFTKEQQFQTIKAFQIWGRSAAAEISVSLYQDPSGGNSLTGIYLGTTATLQDKMQTFLDNVPPPETQTIIHTNYIHTVLLNAGYKITDDPTLLDLQNGFEYQSLTFKSKSVIVKGCGLSDDGIKAYVDKLQAGPASSYFIFDLVGGAGSASSKVAVNPGDGWVHRDMFFLIQMFVYWEEQTSEGLQDLSFIDGIWKAVRHYSSSEAYQNYIDVDEPLSAYYGDNLQSLKATKERWDGTNTFNFNQSIPLP